MIAPGFVLELSPTPARPALTLLATEAKALTVGQVLELWRPAGGCRGLVAITELRPALGSLGHPVVHVFVRPATIGERAGALVRSLKTAALRPFTGLRRYLM